MLNIVIVDDEMELVDYLVEALEKICIDLGFEADISDFSNKYDFICSSNSNQNIDIVFLDIQFGDENNSDGIDIAEFIRNDLHNYNSEIVYISSHKEYALRLFDTDPLNFLIKPLTYESIYNVMKRFLSKHKTSYAKFTYTFNKRKYSLYIKDIIYIHSEGRKIVAHLTDETERVFYGKLNILHKELKEHQFLLIHKSFLVNYRYIEKFLPKSVVMFNGIELPISQSQRENVNKAQMQLEYKR